MNKSVAKNKRMPAWAPWLIGYAAVLLFAVMLTYYWRVIYFLTDVPAAPFSAYVALIFSVIYGAVFVICHYCKNKPCLKAAFLLFLVGILFCFAVAPLQAPDEAKHFLRAYAVSTGKFNFNYDRTYPADVNALMAVFNEPLNHKVNYNAGSLVPQLIANYHELSASGAAAVQNEPIMFTFIPFLPQAVFIFFARLFGFSALGQMYAGRIGALLIYCLICGKAFKNCDKYRGIFIAVAFLPLSLFMAASNSYDSLMLALIYLIVSYFCKKEICSKDIIVLGLCLAIATYIKSLNIVLAFIILLIPKERWKSKWKPWAVFVVLFVGAFLVFWGISRFDSYVLMSNYGALPRGLGEGADPQAQLLFALKNPFPFLFRLISTFVENDFYVFKLGVFGAADMNIALVGSLSILSLAAASALGSRQAEDSTTGTAWGLFLLAGLYSASIMAGLYVLETHYQSIRVQGVQPRYFLPVVLLLFMLLSILLGKAVKSTRGGIKAGGAPVPAEGTLKLEKITLYISLCVAFFAVLIIFRNYFIGQWVPKNEGGWKLVNLFGWQQY